MRHHLLAVLAADAAGYSRLMSTDESGTVAALDAARAVFRDAIAEHQGRVIDTAGDSILAAFESAAGATLAALAAQQSLRAASVPLAAERRLEFRIGIHLGDIIEKPDGSIYGDGVNIAARLQAIAPPGEVVVSDSVRAAIRGRIPSGFRDLGRQTVKNIAEPVRAYLVRATEEGSSAATGAARFGWRSRSRAVLAAAVALALIAIAALIVWRGEDAATLARYLAGRTAAHDAAPRSLAVLAFDNLSGVPADSYFSDGISEELTDVLGRLPNVRVAARTSAFHFRNAKTPIPEIGRQLGVDYIVEGSVRRSAERVRINVRLASTRDGSSLWAESYDRDFKDVLLVQNEIALVIARKLELQIKRIDLASSRASDAEAQRLYFEASQAIFEQTLAGLDKAEALLKQALTIDPGFVLARVRLQDVAWNRANVRRDFARVHRDSPETLKMIADARAVVASAPGLAEAHISLSAHLFSNWQREEAMAVMRRSIALNPNIAVAHQYLSVQLLSDGRMGEALEEMARAVELDPVAANRLRWYAQELVLAGQPERALVYVDRALALRPNVPPSRNLRATALGDLGRDGEMLAELKSFRIGSRLASTAWTALARPAAKSDPELAARLNEGAALPASSDPNDGPVMPLLALGRPSEALAEVGDVDQFQVTDLPLLAFYRPGWDPVRNTPEFAALLAKLDFTEAHARAQAWRAANPPQVSR